MMNAAPSLLLGFAICAALPAQSLITNLATTFYGQPSSGNEPFYPIGSRAVFVAVGSFGRELYVTDGTAAGTHLLKDLWSENSSSPLEIVVLGSEALFTVVVPGLGRELWKTDGTAAGTVLVKDIYPGESSSNPESLCAFGGFVYFGANDGVNGNEVWRTDGTEAGTVMVAELAPGGASSLPERFTAVGNELYFVATANGLGRELYKADATVSTISLVGDLTTGPGSSVFSTMAAFGNRLLFGANVGNGLEPFVSDGTALGTFALADIEPGTSGSQPEDWTVLGGLAVFTASTGNAGREPYVTDGTVAGTVSLGDLRPGPSGSAPRDFAAIGSRLVFSAFTDNIGREVWRTDGTATGTSLLADVWAGLPGSNAADFTMFSGELWFSAGAQGLGNELYRTDGVTTQLVADLVPGSSGFNATDLTAFGNQLLVRASWGGAGVYEPCVTDGTAAGTALLDDIARPVADSSPDLFAELGTDIFFFAKGESVGREPHRTDGTSAGTSLLMDVEPGSLGSDASYRAQRGSDVFFDGMQSLKGRELHVTFAATLSTLTLTNSGVDPKGLASNGNLVIFSGVEAGFGREPWVSDGTVAGTFRLADIRPSGSNGVLAGDDVFVTAGTLTYFLANDGVHGKELWATDGTAAGTFMVADIEPGAGSSNPAELTAVGGELYFTAFASGFGTELWKTDGTTAGTVLVVDLRPGAPSSSPTQVTAAGNVVYFVAGASTLTEIYVCDGTAAGTVVVTNTGVGQVNAYRDLTWTQAGLFFLHDDQTGQGRELWRTTGSLASTQLVVDVAPGRAHGVLEGSLIATLGGQQLLFAANDLENGLQLWRSDGTAANTQPVTTFGGPGYGAVTIGEFFSTGTRTFFACDEGINGIEPWVYDPSTGGAAFVLSYGTACAVGSTAPIISANSLPTINNASFAVTVANAVPVALAIPWGSSGSNNILLGNGCQLLLDLPYTLLPAVVTDAVGSAQAPLAVPNNPNLVGYNLFFQWSVLNPGAGQLLGDFDLSGALQVQVGN